MATSVLDRLFDCTARFTARIGYNRVVVRVREKRRSGEIGMAAGKACNCGQPFTEGMGRVRDRDGFENFSDCTRRCGVEYETPFVGF